MAREVISTSYLFGPHYLEVSNSKIHYVDEDSSSRMLFIRGRGPHT
jgi:hypothetical protein